MDLITIDFETYYDKDYSLSKITTEEYIRNPLFEVIGVGVKVNNGPTEWASGNFEDVKEYLHSFNWDNAICLAHNTMFDGAILSWIFDVHPHAFADTLSMARAIHGVEAGGSLKKLSVRYGLGEKGTEVINALGKRRVDFTDEELERYGDYCVNDVELTYNLFRVIGNGFPKKELRLIDLTLRMFTEPKLELDSDLLHEHLKCVREDKEQLLKDAGLEDREQLMSNVKFADMLRTVGVEPPTKVSPRTGKTTYAFAKTDAAFVELGNHENPKVQALVAARLGTKSTLEETRTERFIEIAQRNDKFNMGMPIPIKYYAAHTGRWGGDDKINLQNLPSRGPNAKQLKRSIMAPDGYVIVDCDSSQIEARVLAWLAMQDDLVQAFANKEDVYKIMASRIYNKSVDDITKEERFVGKTTILGCGYGMGAARFQDQLNSFGVDMDLEECRRIITIYRNSNDKIVGLWRRAHRVLGSLTTGHAIRVGREGVLEVVPEEMGVKLPSGLFLRYEGLRSYQSDKGEQYVYKTRMGDIKIYGGKCVENWTQAIARCIIGEQALLIAKQYPLVLTVHDSVAALVPEAERDMGREYIEKCMRWVPKWADGLPVDCESAVARRYGDCE